MIREGRILYYLAEAEKFYNVALEEFDRWRRDRRDEIIRDATEKAWNAVLQATNALLMAKGVEEDRIKSHRERRLELARLEATNPKIKEMGFRDRFSAREHQLHMLCFYEGEYLPEDVKDNLEKVRRYIEDVKALV